MGAPDAVSVGHESRGGSRCRNSEVLAAAVVLSMEEAEDKEKALKIDEAKSVEDRVAPLKFRLFTEKLVRGVLGHLTEIDAKLQTYTTNWPMHRLGSVERNVLRLAFYEMLFCEDVPPPWC
jgi:N utilization substance protein B